MSSVETINEAFDSADTINGYLDRDVENSVTVELNRPDSMNAINAKMKAELLDALDAIERSDRPKLVLLTGSSESKAFAAGGDIEELERDDVRERRNRNRGTSIYDKVANLKQPVIAKIDGYALGGGCELAMACDIRIASERAKFGQPEINLSLLPGGGGTQRLPRLVGRGQAMKLILTGETIGAQEAAGIGLVDIVCATEELDDEIERIGGEITGKSAIALELNKRAVRASENFTLDQGLKYEFELFCELFVSDEKREGVRAFLANRDPEW